MRYVFNLYVADRGPEVEDLIRTLHDELEKHLAQSYMLEVIDVVDEPEKAMRANVFATPTLSRDLPEPVKRIIGDLTLSQKVMAVLGLVDDGE